MRIAIGVLVGCAVMACASGRSGRSGGGSDGDDDGSGVVTATLSISPQATEVEVDNGAPAHATYTAMLTYKDGTVKDVTDQTQFGIDASYGTFDHNTLTIGVAIRTQVFGLYADGTVSATASADLVSRVKSVRVVAPLAASTPDLFANPGVASVAPTIVYPPSSTIMPRNLGDFELHWTDANGNTVFELSLRNELTDVRVYVTGGNAGATSSWSAFLPAEWTSAIGFENQVTYQVRGVNLAKPGVVGATPPTTVQLSETDMDGGLYYWATVSADGAIGVYRHDMKKPGQPAEQYLTTAQTNGRCVACHVLSRDGTKMAVTYEDSPTPPGPATMVDVATKTIAPQTQRWNFGTFTPDNAQFLSVDHGKLVVRDAATQQILATMTSAASWITQPDLSPDGTKLVYVRPILWNTDFDFRRGEIYMRTYDQATQAFGPETQLISDGTNNFYPSWSPDGEWIAFNKNNDTQASDSSYDDATSQTWIMKADGTHQIALGAANLTTGITNSAVRWAPFAQALGGSKEPMFWLTMSSKRDFGVRLTNTGLAQRAKLAQIWMTPFFPLRAMQDQDPSAPAFRLPFQNLTSSNHTAQWTQRVVDVIE